MTLRRDGPVGHHVASKAVDDRFAATGSDFKASLCVLHDDVTKPGSPSPAGLGQRGGRMRLHSIAKWWVDGEPSILAFCRDEELRIDLATMQDGEDD